MTTRIWSPYESPLGTLTLTATRRGLDGVFFSGPAPSLDESRRRPEAFPHVIAQLDEYFAGDRRVFALPLDRSIGTPFQRAVWDALRSVGYGETITYSELAGRIGRQDRVRAVAAALGHNPLPIIVACHRVVAADGKLTGYLGGLPRKRALLDTERTISRGQNTTIEVDAPQLGLL